MRGKCKCDMAHNSYKMNDVENMFFGGHRSIHTTKTQFFDHINEIPAHGRWEVICHVMSLHP